MFFFKKKAKATNNQIETPVNYQARDFSTKRLENDVKYAIQVADNYIKLLPGESSYLESKVVMEAGPGINFGTSLIFACYHARVIVTDLYIAPWDNNYHSAFYSLLRNTLHNDRPELDVSPFDKLISQGKYTPDILTSYSTPLEDLSKVPEECVDILFSNAVLEHLYDPLKAFCQMERITSHKGRGYHQVDFRDHRNPDRPLEHLLMDKEDFSKIFKKNNGECGNQYRHDEIKRFIEKSGFVVERFVPNMFVDDEYLDEFMPRLRECQDSKYSNYSSEDLKVISGQFYLVKK